MQLYKKVSQAQMDHLLQGSLSQRVHVLIIQILKNFILLLLEKWLSNQVTIVHMSWQLSCHDMYKIVIWLEQ